MNQKTNRLCTVLTLLIFSSNIFAQTWTKSFTAGYNDINGKFLGGSEVLHLIGHKNKLFATVGYWQDGNNVWYGGTNPGIGWGQIIRLDNSNGLWKEDLFLGSNYLRPEILKQIIFKKDALGNLLSFPDTVLIAAGYSVNYITSTVTVKSFARNDNNSTWGESQIIQGGFPAGENYSIRDIEIYTDQITGLERIYATVGTKGLFEGKYNASAPGKIDWIPTPQFGPLSIRPLGITTANSTLHFSSGNKLYKRNDGLSPTYTIAHDFSDLSTNINSAVGGIRGLTTIANPNNSNEALLLMWCPDGQSQGIIYRLEPNGTGGFNRIYETKLSLLIQSFLPGANANYVLGAYNEFYEYVDPVTSDTVHLVGFEASISGGGYPVWNGYYKGGMFAKRDANMQYTLEEINGTIGINDTALVATRCYVKSPFANENALYFGGFDPNSNSATNMAWIFKKEYQVLALNELDKTSHSITVYPIPSNYFIQVKIDSNKYGQYKIISLLGKIMQKGIISSENSTIDISELPASVYLLNIGNETVNFIKTE